LTRRTKRSRSIIEGGVGTNVLGSVITILTEEFVRGMKTKTPKEKTVSKTDKTRKNNRLTTVPRPLHTNTRYGEARSTATAKNNRDHKARGKTPSAGGQNEKPEGAAYSMWKKNHSKKARETRIELTLCPPSGQVREKKKVEELQRPKYTKRIWVDESKSEEKKNKKRRYGKGEIFKKPKTNARAGKIAKTQKRNDHGKP